MPKNAHTIAQLHSSHKVASKVMHKVLQARLQKYMNRELSDVQDGFRKGRETRDQITNDPWIKGIQKHICFIDYATAFDCGSQQSVENS